LVVSASCFEIDDNRINYTLNESLPSFLSYSFTNGTYLQSIQLNLSQAIEVLGKEKKVYIHRNALKVENDRNLYFTPFIVNLYTCESPSCLVCEFDGESAI
jgi:hypothetical protein